MNASLTPSSTTQLIGQSSSSNNNLGHCLNTNFQAYRQDFKNRRSSSEPVHDQGAAAAAVAASAIAASAFVVNNRKENAMSSLYGTSPSSMISSRDEDEDDLDCIGAVGGISTSDITAATAAASAGCCSIVDENRTTKPSSYIGCLQNHIAASVEVRKKK